METNIHSKDYIWTCPSTDGVQYKGGGCPLTSCPANISHIPDRPSGCFYNFLNNKAETGKYEIAYAFATTHRAVEEKVKEGAARIKTLMLFSKIVNGIKHIEHGARCGVCGVGRTTIGPCLNSIECKKRARIINRVLGSYPFSLKQFALTPMDVYTMVHHRQTLFSANQTLNMALADILGLPPKLLKSLLNIRTEV